jgi:hypothetical protein
MDLTRDPASTSKDKTEHGTLAPNSF